MANFFSAAFWKARFFKAFSRQDSTGETSAISGSFAGSASFTGSLRRRRTIDLEFYEDKKTKSIPWLFRGKRRRTYEPDEAPKKVLGKRAAKQAAKSALVETAAKSMEATVDSDATRIASQNQNAIILLLLLEA